MFKIMYFLIFAFFMFEASAQLPQPGDCYDDQGSPDCTSLGENMGPWVTQPTQQVTIDGCTIEVTYKKRECSNNPNIFEIFVQKFELISGCASVYDDLYPGGGPLDEQAWIDLYFEVSAQIAIDKYNEDPQSYICPENALSVNYSIGDCAMVCELQLADGRTVYQHHTCQEEGCCTQKVRACYNQYTQEDEITVENWSYVTTCPAQTAPDVGSCPAVGSDYDDTTVIARDATYCTPTCYPEEE